MKTCNLCKNEKELTEFNKMTRSPDGHAYTCRPCGKVFSKNQTNTIKGRISCLCSSAKQRSAKRQQIFELSSDIIYKMWESQCGKCAYSGMQMNARGDWQVSLERKDPKRGYELDNICLICLELNVSEQWSPEKLATLKTLPRFIDIDYSDEKIESFRYTASHKGKIDLVFIRKKVYSSRERVKRWAGKTRNMEDTLSTLTLEDVVSLLREQKGLCAYSSFQMDFKKRSDFALSIERKDSRRGYYRENVLLVCKIFNVGDHKVESVEENDSYPVWSKDKFDYFWNALHQEQINQKQ